MLHPRRIVPIAPGELAAALRCWERALADAARYLPDGLTLGDAVPLLSLYDRLRAFGVLIEPDVSAVMEDVRQRLQARPNEHRRQ